MRAGEDQRRRSVLLSTGGAWLHSGSLIQMLLGMQHFTLSHHARGQEEAFQTVVLMDILTLIVRAQKHLSLVPKKKL